MLLTLDIPPGVVTDGTDLEAAGRWRDASLVRWRDGIMQPVGGWTQYSITDNDLPNDAVVKSAFQWRTQGGFLNTIYGLDDGVRLVSLESDTVTELTESTALAAGGEYDLWHFDSWGIQPICFPEWDGRIWVWALDYTGATPGFINVISNAPTDNSGIVVTDERFLFALGAGGNFRKVQWCDREDYTTWTPSATNEAGDYELETPGQIVCGVSVNRETLILTTADAWTATYIGAPFVYSFQRAGTDCGIIAPKAVAVTPFGAVWMGGSGFYTYDGGTVREIACPVHSFIFPELDDEDTTHCIFAVHNPQFSEVWWFFPESGETTNNRYVIFNYRDGHWSIGSLSRTAGISGDGDNPVVLINNREAYQHEAAGGSRGGASVYAETAPVMLADGERVMHVTEWIPDEKTQGDVAVTFKTRFHPNGTETSHGPYDPANPASVRFTGRQLRMRVAEDVADADWRFGIQRLRVKQGGLR